MKKIRLSIVLIFIVLVFSTCDKELITTGFPSIVTSEVVQKGNESLIFSGEILWKNPKKLDELGFIWQITNDPMSRAGYKVNLGTQINSGTFRAEIANSIIKGEKYMVRAYAISGKTKIYGDLIEFNPTLDLPLVLDGFEPATGTFGDTIKIRGKRFNNSTDLNQVTFENVISNIVSVNDSVIRCLVPKQYNTILNTIKVVSNGQEAIFSQKFNLVIPPEPEITSISTHLLKYGNILTIYGHNLNLPGISVTLNASTVYTLTPFMRSKDSLKVEIYNQQNPTQLFTQSTYTLGIKTLEKTITSNLNISIVSGWVRKTDFPGSARYKASSFSLYGNCYIGGGSGSGIPFKDLWKYDPITQTWSQMADLPGAARVYPNAFSNTDFGYMGAGYSTDGSSKVQFYDFYKYNPLANSWSSIPDYPDPIASFYPGYTINVNGRLFLSLSSQSLVMRELVNDTWVSHSTISEMTDCPACAVFSFGKKFYVVAGYRINNTTSNTVWEYDSDSGIWTQKSNFPGQPRCASAFFSIGSYGFLGCGRSIDIPSLQQYCDMWRYDPANDKWIRIEDFPGGIRSHLISLTNQNQGYVGLGVVLSSSIYKTDFWGYDPK